MINFVVMLYPKISNNSIKTSEIYGMIFDNDQMIIIMRTGHPL